MRIDYTNKATGTTDRDCNPRREYAVDSRAHGEALEFAHLAARMSSRFRARNTADTSTPRPGAGSSANIPGMRLRAVHFLVPLIVIAVSGCGLIKKKKKTFDNSDDPSSDPAATASAEPPATNRADLARFPDEILLHGQPDFIRQITFARTAPDDGGTTVGVIDLRYSGAEVVVAQWQHSRHVRSRRVSRQEIRRLGEGRLVHDERRRGHGGGDRAEAHRHLDVCRRWASRRPRRARAR